MQKSKNRKNAKIPKYASIAKTVEIAMNATRESEKRKKKQIIKTSKNCKCSRACHE